MPIYEVELEDGRTFEVEADAPPSEADVLAAMPDMARPPATMDTSAPTGDSLPAASTTVGALRAAPAMGRSMARFAASHPAATQKAIGAGISTTAGGIGAAVGGVPGAVVGASIRGVTPAQSVIRETAGRMAGETPEVARTAGRAVAVSNYGKEMGLALKPEQLISTGNPARAFDAYADANGLKAPRVLDQFGKVVYGPEVAVARKAPSAAGRLLTGAVKGAGMAGRVLSAVSGPIGMTDFAQTVDPTRRDIGVMGIGSAQPTPSGDELAQINARNVQGMTDRVAQQDAQWQQLRAAILSRLGLQ